MLTEAAIYSPNFETLWPLIRRLKHTPMINFNSGIVLAPFDGSEVAMHEKWFADPQIRRYMDPKTPYIIDAVTHGKMTVPVDKFIQYIIENPLFVWFRIIHLNYGFIGHACMNGIDYEEMSFERALTIGEKQYWNMGIARTVGNMLLENAKSIGFKKVYSSAHVDNIASVKNLTHQFGPGKLIENKLYFELQL